MATYVHHFEDAGATLGGEQCQIKHCVLNATAKERLPALHVVALAKNPS
jgi:hypothetical protein